MHGNRPAARPRRDYLAVGAADLYLESGDATLLTACERLWEDMTRTKMYLTGGVGAHHIDEAFGDPYELPTERAYCETCAAIASIQLSWRLFLATGRSRYADLIERTLYNGFLGGISLDGSAYSYVNPLQVRDGHQASGGDMDAARLRWFRCACCPPNMMRLLASLQHYAVAGDGGRVAVAQYISGDYRVRLAAGELDLSVRSSLPWTGETAIEVVRAPAAPVELCLRVPQWTDDATVAVNDVPVGAIAADGWITLTGTWNPGDRVRLSLSSPVRLVAADPRVDSTRGDFAVERGPLVYCVESADLPAGQRPDDFVLDPDTPTPLAKAPGLPAEMVAVQLSGFSRAACDRGPWPYQPAPPRSGPDRRATRMTVTAIPYFARGNRQLGAMRVWLPGR